MNTLAGRIAALGLAAGLSASMALGTSSSALAAPSSAPASASASASTTPRTTATIAGVLTAATDESKTIEHTGGVANDDISYEGLVPGTSYTLTVELGRLGELDATTPTDLGATKTFVPTAAKGTVRVAITIPASYAGATLVAREQLLVGSEVVASTPGDDTNVDATIVVAEGPEGADASADPSVDATAPEELKDVIPMPETSPTPRDLPLPTTDQTATAQATQPATVATQSTAAASEKGTTVDQAPVAPETKASAAAIKATAPSSTPATPATVGPLAMTGAQVDAGALVFGVLLTLVGGSALAVGNRRQRSRD